jgi:hypothetical protein
MADDVIKSFLVALGFKIDEAGLRKFNEQIAATEKSVKQFAIGFTALAVGIEESIRRVGRQFENLFYLSQRTGVATNNIKAMQYAFSQVGLTASDANQALTSLTKTMILSPGMKVAIQQWAPNFNAAIGTAENAVEALVHRYAEILKIGGVEGQLMEANYAQFLEDLGQNAMLYR